MNISKDGYGTKGYGKFLEHNLANFRRILSEPNERFPNGRMSHDVAMQGACEYEAALMDYRADCGLFAIGHAGKMSFAGYSERPK